MAPGQSVGDVSAGFRRKLSTRSRNSGGGAVAVNDAGIAVGSCNKYDAVNFGQRTVISEPEMEALLICNNLGVVANPPDGTWLLTNATARFRRMVGCWLWFVHANRPFAVWARLGGDTSAPAMLAGDYNGNGMVDTAQATTVCAITWGKTSHTRPKGVMRAADYNSG